MTLLFYCDTKFQHQLSDCFHSMLFGELKVCFNAESLQQYHFSPADNKSGHSYHKNGSLEDLKGLKLSGPT